MTARRPRGAPPPSATITAAAVESLAGLARETGDGELALSALFLQRERAAPGEGSATYCAGQALTAALRVTVLAGEAASGWHDRLVRSSRFDGATPLAAAELREYGQALVVLAGEVERLARAGGA